MITHSPGWPKKRIPPKNQGWQQKIRFSRPKLVTWQKKTAHTHTQDGPLHSYKWSCNPCTIGFLGPLCISSHLQQRPFRPFQGGPAIPCPASLLRALHRSPHHRGGACVVAAWRRGRSCASCGPCQGTTWQLEGEKKQLVDVGCFFFKWGWHFI